MQASRLLACARLLHPGSTTQGQTLAALSSLDAIRIHRNEPSTSHPTLQRDEYWIDNYPKWVGDHGPYPDWVNEYLFFLPYTAFSVTPYFENGSLTMLEFQELLDNNDRGSIHPYIARAKILSTNTPRDVSETDSSFTGYRSSRTVQGGFKDEGSILGEHLTLDERATPKQFENALNFQLSCLTALWGCRDARKLLPIEK